MAEEDKKDEVENGIDFSIFDNDLTEEEIKEIKEKQKIAGKELRLQRIREEEEKKLNRRKKVMDYYYKNYEDIKQNQKNRYAKNPDYIRQWRKKNPDRVIEQKEQAKNRCINNPKKYWIKSTIHSHKRLGHKIYIKEEELLEKIELVDSKCQICDSVLDFSYYTKIGKPLNNSPTLDRMNNEREIRKDNILILCHRCNSMKHVLTLKEYYIYCKNFIIKYENGELK